MSASNLNFARLDRRQYRVSIRRIRLRQTSRPTLGNGQPLPAKHEYRSVIGSHEHSAVRHTGGQNLSNVNRTLVGAECLGLILTGHTAPVAAGTGDYAEVSGCSNASLRSKPIMKRPFVNATEQ
jgi:hypothetical protein